MNFGPRPICRCIQSSVSTILVSCPSFSTDLRRGSSSQPTLVAFRHSICDANVASWASNGRTRFLTPRSVREPVLFTSRSSSALVARPSLGMWLDSGRRYRSIACFASRSMLDQSTLCHLVGNALVAGKETLGSSPFSIRVFPSKFSGTVLSNAVTVCRRNVPRRTSVHDDDDAVSTMTHGQVYGTGVDKILIRGSETQTPNASPCIITSIVVRCCASHMLCLQSSSNHCRLGQGNQDNLVDDLVL